jgi:hypothetical protein
MPQDIIDAIFRWYTRASSTKSVPKGFASGPPGGAIIRARLQLWF